MMMHELMWKTAKKVIKNLKNPLLIILRLLLFFLRSIFFDQYYKEFTMQEFKEAIEKFKQYAEEKQLHYENEFYDCDDFALEFKTFCSRELKHNGVGVAIGILSQNKRILGGHAWNIVAIQGELWYFEPQTYDLFKGDVSPDGFKYTLLNVIW